MNKNRKKGADLAKWNKIKDYDRFRDAGVEFAIVKVNNSGNTADGRFYEHVNGLTYAGIPIIGGYNYSYANTVEKAKKAANAFVSLATPKDIDMMWLDLEDACMRGLGSKILDIIFIYKSIAESAGMKFGIYTGASFYNPCLKPYEKELAGIPFWWARYPSTKDRKITADVPQTSYLPTNLDLDGWQYSSKGVIDGATGYIDLNVWYEDEPFTNTGNMIPIDENPFTEPVYDVKRGVMGNDANWVQWYCWRFGLFVDKNGNADSTQIDGIFGAKTEAAVKEVQRRLGMPQTGAVTNIDKAIWKKLA